MYVFTSFIFFLLLYSIIGNLTQDKKKRGKVKDSTEAEYKAFAATLTRLQAELPGVRDADRREEIQDSIEETETDMKALSVAVSVVDSSAGGTTKLKIGRTGLGGEPLPNTVEEYDSIQAHTPPAKRQPWLYRWVNRRAVNETEEFHADKKRFYIEVWERILHTFPKVLFVSLPLFALLLRLLNLRRRKTILYVDHGIFTIHLYCATFILMMAMMLVSEVKNWLDWNWMDWILGLLFLACFVYEYKAMRGFYKQGRGKTFLKFLLLNTAAIAIVGVLTAVFALWAIFEV